MSQARSILTNKEAQILILYGLSGSGKTQIARALCREKVTSSGIPVYILDASTAETLHSSFSTFAISAQLVKNNELLDRESLRAIIHTFLSKLKQDWLLLFDGCIEGRYLKPWIPVKHTGSIIVTSQTDITDLQPSKSICVQQLTQTEALGLFCVYANIEVSTIKDEEKQMVSHISTELMGNLAIAVAQAGAYIGQSCPVREDLTMILANYIDDFKLHRDMALEEVDTIPIDEYGKSILTTSNVALHSITIKNEHAVHLLSMLCCFHHENIYLVWFEIVAKQFNRIKLSGIDSDAKEYEWFRRLFRPENSTRKWSRANFTRALQTLKAYGLLQVQDDAIQVHPLIHSSSAIRLSRTSPAERESVLRVAAAFLCEIFVVDNINGYNSAEGAQLRIKLYAHVTTCIQLIKSKTTALLEPSENPSVTAYTLNRFVDYLNCPLLTERPGNENEVLIPLRIAAFINGIRHSQLASRHTLNALRRLLLWISEEGCLKYETVIKIYSLIDSLIETSESLDLGSINVTEEYCDLLYEQMVATGSIRGRPSACEVAKKALNNLEFLEDRLPTGRYLHFQIYYHSTLCLYDATRDDRIRWLNILEEYLDKVIAKEGHTSKLAIHACYAMSIARRKDKVGTTSNNEVDMASYNNDSRTGIISRANFIRTKISKLYEDKQHFTDETLQLHEHLYDLIAERNGEWHLNSIDQEINVYQNRIIQKSLQCPNLFGERWKTRDDRVIPPVELAIILKLLEADERAAALWTGYLNQLELHSQESSRIVLCAQAFRGAIEDHKTTRSQSELLLSAAEEMESNSKSRGEVDQLRTRTISTARDLFVQFEKLQGYVEQSSTTNIESQSSVILRLLYSSAWCQEALLFLTIQYLLYLIYQPQHFTKQISSADAVTKIGALVVSTFGTRSPLFYRWKIFESIFYRQAGLDQLAEDAELILVRESVPSSDQAAGLETDTDAQYQWVTSSSKEGFHATMVGDSIISIASASLGRVQKQYTSRNWLEQSSILYEKVISTRVLKLGFHSQDMIDSLKMAMYGYCDLHKWTKVWDLLESYESYIYGSSLEERITATERINRSIILNLPKYANFKAIALISFWLTIALQKPGLGIRDSKRTDLWFIYNLKTQERMAYSWLGYPINAEAAHQEVQSLSAAIQDCFNTLDADIVEAYREAMGREDAFWSKASENGTPDREGLLRCIREMAQESRGATA